MLTELSIQNFTIINQLTISFNDGLTVLTGETGAGKSIIIDAIGLLAGGRGSVEYVRHGENKAVLEGLFTIEDPKHAIYKLFAEYGIEYDSEGMIVLHRTISAKGKSICRVNGSLVTLAILREFGQTLIDIHSQHETQSLLDSSRHLALLDLFNQEHNADIYNDYQKVYQKLKKTKTVFDSLKHNEQESIQRLDLLRFQLNEINQANLTVNEDLELRKEREKLVNFEQIYTNVEETYNALRGEHKGLDWLSLGLSALETASSHEEELKKVTENYSNNYYMFEEISIELRNYLDQLAYEPERLAMIESRLNEIHLLIRKYGSTVNEIIEYAAEIEDEIEQLENRDQSLQEMTEEITELAEDALIEAKQLHDLRVNGAKRLIKVIKTELKDLYMEKAQFETEIQIRGGKPDDPELLGKPVQLGETGFDQVRFLLSTNPGEPVKPLDRVASGGELSRIMLAFKKVFAKHQGVTSVIFDEVDTGVSGRVAQAIAEKIHTISLDSQVLCITHLPQVAAMADNHLLIEKGTTNKETYTTVIQLEESNRIEELARMTTGTTLTDASVSHAKELITRAKDFKSN
ncbi:DNA repair protein RecN [Amphibacillus indicireducens]|uniref:DNA repair protein RecN n=1 Tax=Amphibacillus indicireducens TaxID=1076330 RepID=A0ABP7VFN7_9BACI